MCRCKNCRYTRRYGGYMPCIKNRKKNPVPPPSGLMPYQNGVLDLLADDKVNQITIFQKRGRV